MRAAMAWAVILVLMVFYLAVPTPSAGRTSWNVKAGGYSAAQALQTQKFLPTSITINEGDSVTWTLGGNAHTMFFPAADKPPDLIVPGKAKGELLFNSLVYYSTGKTYNGSGPFSAGVVEPGFRTTSTVTFTKAGTYHYLCMFHPGMAGAVVVQPAGSPYPKTQAEYDTIGQKEAKESFAAARARMGKGMLTSATDKAGKTTYTMRLAGSVANKFTILRFVPQELTIKPGDTVTWKMDDPTEIHTVTFTSGGKTPGLDLFQPHNTVVANPLVMGPAGDHTYAGRGYFNSGIMELQTPHGVRSYSLTFTTPGRFNYVCPVHADVGMKGTIVVIK